MNEQEEISQKTGTLGEHREPGVTASPTKSPTVCSEHVPDVEKLAAAIYWWGLYCPDAEEDWPEHMEEAWTIAKRYVHEEDSPVPLAYAAARLVAEVVKA